MQRRELMKAGLAAAGLAATVPLALARSSVRVTTVEELRSALQDYFAGSFTDVRPFYLRTSMNSPLGEYGYVGMTAASGGAHRVINIWRVTPKATGPALGMPSFQEVYDRLVETQPYVYRDFYILADAKPWA
jgi:hypothetical protein